MKVVYNACFGGFSLSDAAIRRYAEIKGVKLYEETTESGLRVFWTCPPSERGAVLFGDAWQKASPEQRQASNDFYSKHTIGRYREFCRHDPVLVQVVEELGAAANGDYASLKIAELPDGQKYRIDEYDGTESVETPDSYEWVTP